MPVKILGIESSCDETSAAVISDNKILSNLKKLLENQNIGRLWIGLTPVLLRIFPVSALSMLTYESSRKLLS